jgi:hypothetical protein
MIFLVFENKVLRRIFGPERDEVTGEWRRPHNEEHNNLYSSPKEHDQIPTGVSMVLQSFRGNRGMFATLKETIASTTQKFDANAASNFLLWLPSFKSLFDISNRA